jgi:DNA polymerase I
MSWRKLHTVFGWTVRPDPERPNPRSLRNFPLQANGAEMLRLACCLATERGVQVIAPIHDALMIESSIENLPEQIALAKAAMSEASRFVLGGFELRVKGKIVQYPDRFTESRGEKMWNTVLRLVEKVEAKQGESRLGIQPEMTLGE